MIKTPGTPGSVTYSPSSLSCSSSSDFNVVWSAASGGNRYQLQERRRSKNADGTYNSWSGWTTLNSTIASTSFTRNNLPTGYQYDYQVRARYYASGTYSSYSAWRSASEIGKPHCAPGTPGLPTFSSTSLLTNSSYSISWSAASGTVSSYQLQEQFNGGSWATVQNSNDRSKSFSNRTRGNYCYRVRAVNSDSSSAYTTAQCAFIKYPTPSVSVSISGAVAVGSNTYDSGWIGEYKVHWNITGQAISSAELEADGVVQNLSGMLNGSQSYNQPDNMGTENKSYRYRIKACNADACANSPEVTVVVRPYPIPSPPGNFDGNNGVSAVKAYTLSWTAPSEWGELASDTPTWYVIKRDGQSQQLPGTQTSISYSGEYGHSYNHQIKACTFDIQDNHCSNFTLPKTVYIQYPAPSVPQNLSVSSEVALTTGSFTVSWNASTGTVHTYELQEQFEGGSWSTIQNTNALNKTLNKNSQGNYCYRVRARNVDNYSAYTGSQCLLVMDPFSSVDHKASSDAHSFYLSMMLQLQCDCSDGHMFEYKLDNGPWFPYKKPLVFDKTTQVSTRIVYRGIHSPIETEIYTRSLGAN